MLRPWKLEFAIDSQSGKAIYLQIADKIIEAIQTGRLKAGEPLPGSRNLSILLKVNRNTIVDALQVLINEGWLISKERKGTFVADIVPKFNKSGGIEAIPVIHTEISITKERVAFDDGNPDSKIAPVTELARAYRQIFGRKARWQMMDYGDPMGDLEFRRAIMQMLNHQRGMRLHEDMLCITRGSQMAMYLIAQCLIEKGDSVIVENPGYKPAWQAFEHAGAKLIPVPVDENGVKVDEITKLLKNNKKIKAVYTTPHRQYPTTVTLSLQRRMELIELSNEYGFLIIEDDYDNEFHFGYRPVMPISSYVELKNYIYVGTLSKVVAPALRIGYLACNVPQFIERIGRLRKIIDVQSDNIMEQAILQLIQDGTLKRHIRKATHHYKNKRDYVIGLLDKFLKDKIEYIAPEGGLAFWITPKKLVDWKKLSAQLSKKGVKIVTPEKYSYAEPVNGFRLGYGSLNEAQLEEGTEILGKLL